MDSGISGFTQAALVEIAVVPEIGAAEYTEMYREQFLECDSMQISTHINKSARLGADKIQNNLSYDFKKKFF